ncbi:MAG: right-handed parallel beta-helix repeat-containing protein [Planctomycetota bacterium]
MKTLPLFHVLVFSVLLSSYGFADTLLVPGEYSTIQAAIDAASDFDEVHVAPGTYFENINFLGKRIELLGTGGPEITTINGNQTGSVVTFQNGEVETSVLNGFTVTNGSGTLEDGKVVGGNIYCWQASPRIKNNHVRLNAYVERGGGFYGLNSNAILETNRFEKSPAYLGCAICFNGGSPVIHENLISRNTGGIGIGMSLMGTHDVEVSENLISSNIGDYQGGGIDIYQSSLVTVEGNYFLGNDNSSGGWGAGLYSDASNGVQIRNNTFEANIAGHEGGGIYIEHTSNITIECNTFLDNLAKQSGGGAYISNFCQAMNMVDNDFIRNEAQTYVGGGLVCTMHYGTFNVKENRFVENKAAAHGGAMILVGDLWFDYNVYLIEGNFLKNNIAQGRGGGICADKVDMDISGNIIIGNSAGETGGGIYVYFSEEVLSNNNIIAGNMAHSSGGGVYIDEVQHIVKFTHDVLFDNSVLDPAGAGGGLFNYDSYGIVLRNSIIWGNHADIDPQLSGSNIDAISCDVEGGWSGPSNIDSDPQFVNPEEDDYHLLYTSPCLGAGNKYFPDLPETDFEGDPRIAFDTPDMGADEFYPHLYCTGDFSPQGYIEGKFVGMPGAWPAGLFIGSGVMDPPMNHMWGQFHLEAPWFLIPLVPIPLNGMLLIPTTLPATPLAPYDIPMQGLIGYQLTNLFVLEVR